MRALLLVSALIVLASCGSDESKRGEQPDPKLDPRNTRVYANFSCDSQTCNSEKEYCLLTQNLSGFVFYRKCAANPTASLTCESAQKDAKEVQLPNVTNCKNAIQCIHIGTQVTVTCTNMI